MTNKSPLISFHYSWREPRRFGIRSRPGPGHERIDIYRCSTLRELISAMLKRVAEIDSDVLAKLEEIDDREFSKRTHRKRRYFAKHRDTLYLQASHLESNSVEVGEYWLATNIGAQEVRTIVKQLAEAACVPLSALSQATL